MKSSDSRTNSKYKSPYGCRTNSHWVINKYLPFKLTDRKKSKMQILGFFFEPLWLLEASINLLNPG